MANDTFLVADVGGTNTRVGLATPDGFCTHTPQSYRNADFDGLAQVLQAFVTDHNPGPIHALCAGVAGPVRQGTAQLTNLNWFIDSAELVRVTGAGSALLINDLQAQGYALDDLPTDSLDPLIPGADAPPDATRLVIGLGTGCNIAVVHRIDGDLWVPPSETGHTSLPHMGGKVDDLIAHLANTLPHKPIEAALSGPGLMAIHHWLNGSHATPAQIIAHHLSGRPEATEALTLFAQIFGIVAGDIALAHLPMGGIYLIGGTARAIAPYLLDLGFIQHFTAKGPYTSILQDIPVSLVTDDAAALKGCTRYLRQWLK